MDKIKSITFDYEAQNNISLEVWDKMREDRKQAEKEQLILHGVTNSFDLAKANQAIELIKHAECESDVLDAVFVKEELNWFAVTDDIKDLWNEYYGDAKKYLP